MGSSMKENDKNGSKLCLEVQNLRFLHSFPPFLTLKVRCAAPSLSFFHGWTQRVVFSCTVWEWIRNVLIHRVRSILWGSSDNYTNAKHEPCSNFLSTTVKYTDFLLAHWVSDSMAVREVTNWVSDNMEVREVTNWVSDSMAVREVTHWVSDSNAIRELTHGESDSNQEITLQFEKPFMMQPHEGVFSLSIELFFSRV